MAILKCVKCGCSLDECASYFTRTNPTGVAAIWACAYPCGQGIPDNTHPLIAAIEGKKEDPIHPISYVETPSIAALKANLHYYERLKMKAFEEHKEAIIKAHEAMTALNNALLREPR